MKKGETAWNKGKKLSKEHRQNVINALIGRHHSEETKQKMSKSSKGERNGKWKGYDTILGRQGLHEWVRRNLPEPDLCENCNEVPPYDLANITGMYNRDFSNWKYWCRRCHVNSDDRLVKANNVRKVVSLIRQVK